MDTKAILAKGAETVIFLLAAFNNFLVNIAPPGESNSLFAVGIGSICTLFVLLFISAMAKGQYRKQFKKVCYCASLFFFALALVSSFAYQKNLHDLTFPYPPENQKTEQIKGTVLTALAEQYSKENPQFRTPAEMVAAFGGLANTEMVWTKDSIAKAKMILTINYVIVILSVATMLFCLTEGILGIPKDKKTPSHFK
jgi:hypothetical protein